MWFSDAGAEEKMLDHLESLEDMGQASKAKEGTSFLDLGTGNGHLLFALRDEGWQGRAIGVDYSAKSVELARQIARQRAQDQGGNEVENHDVQFEEWDLLKQAPGSWLGYGFDIVLDKGTFDAISLSAEEDAQGRRVCESYRGRVEPLLKADGRFLITSCNWTADELRGWFEVEGGALVYEDAVKHPTFTFGGVTGQKVCTLCFKKKST